MTPHSPDQAAADDTATGLAMFLIFTAAILIVSGVVALLALVNSWWMLGVAVVVHTGMTTIVTATIARALNGQAITMARVDGASVAAATSAAATSLGAPVAAQLSR